VSVHGANRLSTNSLVDLVVFGSRAGQHMERFVRDADFVPVPGDADDEIRSRIELILSGGGTHGENIRTEMESVMMEKVGIYRTESEMSSAVESISKLRERYAQVRTQDTRGEYNTDLLACKTLVKDVASGDGDTISVEPLGNLPVERDLMVRQSDFFENCLIFSLFFLCVYFLILRYF